MEILSTSSVFTITVIALITVILSNFFPADTRIGRTIITWLASDSFRYSAHFANSSSWKNPVGPVLAQSSSKREILLDFTLNPSINQGDSFDRFIDRSSTRNIFSFWGAKGRKRWGILSPSFTMNEIDVRNCSQVCGSFALIYPRWTQRKILSSATTWSFIYQILLESVWIRWKTTSQFPLMRFRVHD